MSRRVTLVGIGAGDPDQLTVEAVEALRSASFAIVSRKREDDPLEAARRAIVDRHAPGLELVAVRDPERDRRPESTTSAEGYAAAVDQWHAARSEAYEQVLMERDGDAVFLVWGDPAFYDSTIRVMERIVRRGNVVVEWSVIPGISALQLLAARHRIVLHDVGQPIVMTTGRRLAEAVQSGADNIAVMLTSRLELGALSTWDIWWGANLGTASERLVAGRVVDVLPELLSARDSVLAEAGWVMDVYLLRKVDVADEQ